MTDTMLEHSYPGPGARSTSAKTGLDSKDRDRVTSKMRSSSHTRHLAISPSAPSRHTPARESGKPATIPRESDQAKSRLRQVFNVVFFLFLTPPEIPGDKVRLD